ncbi:MAG: hypothetical protein IPG02_13005 [Ignavibacteria bacterium]|nr:hypothetical protein [Ignavibacteria bacterium]
MPILSVEIVTRPDEQLRPELAAELSDRTGEVFGSAPGTTWVKVVLIPEEHYSENDCTSGSIHPVFVSVLKEKLPSPESMQAEVAKLTEVIAQICARPLENVHIIYLPEAAGRIAFGGKLTRK